MNLEEKFRRIKERAWGDADWPYEHHFHLNARPPTHIQRQTMVERIEAGARFASGGNEIILRITYRGTSFLVSARVKSIRQLRKTVKR